MPAVGAWRMRGARRHSALGTPWQVICATISFEPEALFLPAVPVRISHIRTRLRAEPPTLGKWHGHDACTPRTEFQAI